MPLEPYPRGKTWWVKGRIQFNGRDVTGYVRESTGASTEAGAREWIAERQAREERRQVLGHEEADERDFTFNDAVVLYPASTETAKYLMPIVERIGSLPVKKITAKMIRDLGASLYPKNSADTWRRWVIAPARAVINNANDLGLCPPIRIKGYDRAERVRQDRNRGKISRKPKVPGDWLWIIAFRAKASKRHGALALFMFTTGARVGQATALHPDALDLDAGTAVIPGAKGHEDRVVELMPELIAELRALPAKFPRGWDRRYPENKRVFGWASKDGPRKGWITACKKAGIPHLPPHSAGRHGFGQEMRVRQGVDTKSIESVGGWSAKGGMIDKIYTHAEDSDSKILEALRTGFVQAKEKTGLKPAEKVGK